MAFPVRIRDVRPLVTVWRRVIFTLTALLTREETTTEYTEIALVSPDELKIEISAVQQWIMAIGVDE